MSRRKRACRITKIRGLHHEKGSPTLTCTRRPSSGEVVKPGRKRTQRGKAYACGGKAAHLLRIRKTVQSEYRPLQRTRYCDEGGPDAEGKRDPKRAWIGWTPKSPFQGRTCKKKRDATCETGGQRNIIIPLENYKGRSLTTSSRREPDRGTMVVQGSRGGRKWPVRGEGKNVNRGKRRVTKTWG